MFWPADLFFFPSLPLQKYSQKSCTSLLEPLINTPNNFQLSESTKKITSQSKTWQRDPPLLVRVSKAANTEPSHSALLNCDCSFRDESRRRYDLGLLFCELLAQNKLAWTQEATQLHQPGSVPGFKLIILSSSLLKHRLSHGHYVWQRSHGWPDGATQKGTFPFCHPSGRPFRYSPVLLWMVLTVVVVRGGDEDRSEMHSSSWEQPFSMALT